MRLANLRLPPGVRLTMTIVLGEPLPDDRPSSAPEIRDAVRVELTDAAGQWIGRVDVPRDIFDDDDELVQMMIDTHYQPRLVEDDATAANGELLIYCPECGPRLTDNPKTGEIADLRVPAGEEAKWRGLLPSIGCSTCGARMAMKDLPPIQLMRDDEQ